MKNLTKKISLILMTVALVAMAFFVPTFFGTESASADLLDDNITYNSVEKEISISDKKVLDVTEYITVTYQYPNINVGISRNLSKVNRITRIWQGKEYVTTTVSNLYLESVMIRSEGGQFEDEYNFVSTDEDYFYINTGADGDYKYGTYTYQIKYQYDMGDDFISAFDDFTFDLMDYGFASPVENFSATVTLPKTFLQEGQSIEDVLSFRTRGLEPVLNEDVNFSYNEQTLTFSCSASNFWTGEGLTVQLILPNGYFDAYYTPNALYWICFALGIVALIVPMVVIWLNGKKRREVVVTPEFYPPKGYSPLDIARAYRGKIKSEDFASLVIFWASKGYVSMKTEEDDSVTVTKLKDLPRPELDNRLFESNAMEKNYFDAIFAGGDTVTFSQSQKAKRDVQSAAEKLYKIEKKKEKNLRTPRIVIAVFSILPLLLFIIWNVVLGWGQWAMMVMLLFPIIAIVAALYLDAPLFFKIFWSLIFGGIPLVMLAWSLSSSYDLLYLCYVLSVIFVLSNCSGLLLKANSKEELEDMGKILGFKNFLVTAELDRLEMLIKDNPNYYYDILPFCYVYDITDVMEEKFDSLHVPKPEYCGNNSAVAFGILLGHSMHSYSIRPVSTTSFRGISSGGGFGGGRGGSFGGGGGGGGSRGR